MQNGDANGDGFLDLSDGISLLRFLYGGSRAPASACGSGRGEGGQAQRTPVTVVLTFDPSGPITDGKQWVDDDGIWHVREGLQPFTVSGDFTGIFRGLGNLNLDLNTLEGDGFGSFHMEVEWQGRSGTWDGRYSGPITAGVLSTEFVAQGGGEFAKMKFMGTAVQTDTGFVSSAMVLDPGR
jgi:hypothetical protein